MEYPDVLKYTKEHEWVLVEDNIATVGITEYAQNELGDCVYVELPQVGDKVTKDDSFGSVESVKAVSDLFAPVSGSVTEINALLQTPNGPETINEDPYEDGWMIKIQMSDKNELKDLMSAEEYSEYIEQEQEDDDDGSEEEVGEEEK